MKTTTPQLLAKSYATLYPTELLPLCPDTFQMFANWLERYHQEPDKALATTNWCGKVTKALFHALAIKMPKTKVAMLAALQTTCSQIKVRACSIRCIDHPEWGTFGVMLEHEHYYDIHGAGGARVLHKSEANDFWEVIPTNTPTLLPNTPTPPLEELAIMLNAAAFWADGEADEDHPDPLSIVCNLAREASELVNHLPPCYAAAPALLKSLDYLLQQTVDQDLAHGIGLTEGEEDARQQALDAIAAANGLPSECSDNS